MKSEFKKPGIPKAGKHLALKGDFYKSSTANKKFLPVNIVQINDPGILKPNTAR